ncbi:MAG: enoyl-CoA hydratase/isomerase family protein [Candidimonas sp.]|nr:MAG: enoyl-CoA hydratase/isomerase family protein [Candidimonas sp.]
MPYENLLYELRENGVGVVTLNRPRCANAMNQAMLHELSDLCRYMENDDSVRCVVITGAGAAFSGGFDLKDQAIAQPQGVAQWVPLLEADFNGIMSFWNFPKPCIAAVNGPALAGGFELMLGCDLAVASEFAIFGEPELKFGAGIVAMLLPWFVGPKVAREMIYTGEDNLSAARALSLGLVNKVVPADQVLPEALQWAARLAHMDPMVLNRTKLAINRTYEIMGMRDALRSALDIDIMIEGEGSSVKRDFLRIIREQGLQEALRWRDGRSGGA